MVKDGMLQKTEVFARSTVAKKKYDILEWVRMGFSTINPPLLVQCFPI